jgi:prepilin-type N-terminal cleavage/methylation domain-containing protein
MPDRQVKRTRRRRSTLRRAVSRGRGDEGMTLIELIVAVTILSMVMTGLAASIGLSLKAVQLARARQVAESAANKRLEELRDVDYPNLALESMPVFNSDPNNPDHFVSGTTYDYSGKGQFEQMIVETNPPGPVAHIESPVVVGGTVVDVYQYVTWVDDPTIPGTQNLRRVTVVVQYHQIAVKGTDHILRESALFTPGTVTLPDAAPSTTTTTTSPPATTTTTAPASTCGSFSVSGGGASQVGYTATTTVTVTLAMSSCGNDVDVNLSNDGITWGPDVPYDNSNPTLAWTLTGGDGVHQISGIAHNGSGSWALGAQSIILDTTLPTTPGTLTRTASCAGTTRTVNLSWGTSSDTNLVGYRVYRSTDGVTWQSIASTTGTSATDTNSKSLTTVRYYVKAYDKAGNDSNATNTITLSKNQCS